MAKHAIKQEQKVTLATGETITVCCGPRVMKTEGATAYTPIPGTKREGLCCHNETIVRDETLVGEINAYEWAKVHEALRW